MAKTRDIVVISGGVGAARLLRGLIDVVPGSSITAIVNVADDLELHGLSISPDLDTVMYTLADAIDPDRGWGLRDETWNAMETLGRYGDRHWFSLGDRDLGTHMHRSAMLEEGATLTDATEALRKAWDIEVNILPVTNDRVSTRVTRADTGENISFQEYFVGLQHAVPVASVAFDGIEQARPSSEVSKALEDADVLIIAPSNPLVSIAPVLEIPGVAKAIEASTASKVALSPIVGGNALKGPAADMLISLGHRCDAAGIAALWEPYIDVLLIDDADASLAHDVANEGVVPFVTDTIMQGTTRRAAVARSTLTAADLSIGGLQ